MNYEIFKAWMIGKGYWTGYRANIDSKKKEEEVRNGPATSYISAAFLWRTASGGTSLWGKVDREWEEYLRNFNSKPKPKPTVKEAEKDPVTLFLERVAEAYKDLSGKNTLDAPEDQRLLHDIVEVTMNYDGREE